VREERRNHRGDGIRRKDERSQNTTRSQGPPVPEV
jgi:hypothetical protein